MNDSYLQTYKVRDLLIEHVSGPSPNCEERNIQSDNEWGLLKTTAVVWDGWNPNAHKVPPQEYWNKHHLEVKSGDVLVTKAGPRNRVGVVVYVDKTPPHLMVSGKMIGLKPNHKVVDYRALAAALSSESSQRYLDIRTTGMAEAQLNFTNQLLLDTEVLLPALNVQKKISSVLSNVDNLIDKTESLIDKYFAIKQGMMNDLFTRGIDLSGTPETNQNYGKLRPSITESPGIYKETKLGWLPKDWGHNNLKKISNAIGDGVHYSVQRVEEGVPFLFVSCIKNGEIQWDKAACISQLTYEEISKNCKPYKGLILFTAVGSYGRIAYVKDDSPFGFERNIAYIKPIAATINSRFLFYSLQTREVKDQVESLVMGNAQKLISLGNLGRIIINLPSIHEQETIHKKLDIIDSKIESEIILNKKYKNIKKGLMHDLLTGKVRVN